MGLKIVLSKLRNLLTRIKNSTTPHYIIKLNAASTTFKLQIELFHILWPYLQIFDVTFIQHLFYHLFKDKIFIENSSMIFNIKLILLIDRKMIFEEIE